MKAYVIKNKEGKYFVADDIFGENILNAYIWVKERYAEMHIGYNHFKDCEIVEITIAEGDLEQQLAEKDKEIEKYANDLSIALSEQSDMAWKWTQSEKQLRHQICEEIREKLKREYTRAENKYWLSMDKVCFVNGYDIFDEFEWEKILDQIEQGEIK